MREIGQKEAEKARGFPILLDGKNWKCLPDGRKGMQRPKKIKDV